MRNQPSLALRSIENSGWLILALMSLAGLILRDVSTALGVATGGACALGSFRMMDVYFARIFQKNVSRPKWWHHVLYIMRFFALMGVVALAIGWAGLPVVSVVIGLTVPPLAIFIHGARYALRIQGSTRA
ncbi:MAG: hypothetical protein J4F48_00760 [Nitrospinae bacterium]|nr:hypothetical protein [Nitrospinota bacterium]